MRELLDRDLADVAVVGAAEKIPEHALPQRPLGDRHALERRALEDRRHDRRAARDHRDPVLPQALQRDLLEIPGLDELVPEPREPFGIDAALGLAVLEEDLGERARVPDDPTASRHPVFSKRAAMVWHLGARGGIPPPSSPSCRSCRRENTLS
jgi:hypothetical protein